MAPESDSSDAPSRSGDALVGRQARTSVAASVVGMGLRYVASILTTRILGLALFGNYVTASTVAQLLSTIAAAGMSPGAVPFVARARRDSESKVRSVFRGAWTISTVASLVAAAVVWLAAPWLAATAFEAPPLEWMLRFFAVYLVFRALTTVTLALAQGLLGVRARIVIDKIVIVGVTLAGLVVVWLAELGPRGVLVATILGPFAGLVVGFAFLRRRVPSPLGGQADPAPIREMLRACWPLLGTGLFGFILAWMDVLMLGVLREESEVGIYGACVRLLPVIIVVHESMGGLFMAHASERYLDRDAAGLAELYKRTARWSLWSGLGIATLLIVWAEPILGLYGEEFVAGGSALLFLGLSRAATSATGMGGRMLVVSGHARLTMINMIALVVFNGALDLLLIPEHGAIGAAIATLTSLSIVNLAQVTEVWWLHRMQPWTWNSLVAVGLAVLAGFAFATVRDGWGGAFGWIPAAIAFVALWAVAYFAYGMTAEERARLYRMLGR